MMMNSLSHSLNLDKNLLFPIKLQSHYKNTTITKSHQLNDIVNQNKITNNQLYQNQRVNTINQYLLELPYQNN